MEFGERLKKMIKSKGYTQAQFAELVYTSPQTVWRWMNNKAEPGMNDIKNICKILDISADYLLGLTEKK